jgi:hypothetical protein
VVNNAFLLLLLKALYDTINRCLEYSMPIAYTDRGNLCYQHILLSSYAKSIGRNRNIEEQHDDRLAGDHRACHTAGAAGPAYDHQRAGR